MLKYLANENMAGEAVMAARDSGYDVAWISEVAPGADDEQVLGIALDEQRVLITFDKDFGEMVFHRGRDASCGILLLRPRLRAPDYLARFLVSVLGQPLDWSHQFTVAREGLLRSVPLR